MRAHLKKVHEHVSDIIALAGESPRAANGVAFLASTSATLLSLRKRTHACVWPSRTCRLPLYSAPPEEAKGNTATGEERTTQEPSGSKHSKAVPNSMARPPLGGVGGEDVICLRCKTRAGTHVSVCRGPPLLGFRAPLETLMPPLLGFQDRVTREPGIA